MAGFCGNCGSPAGAHTAFCPQCGARLGKNAAEPAPAPAPPQPPPPPPPAYSAPPAYGQAPPPAYTQGPPPPSAGKSGSGLKILLAVVAIFVFFGIAAIGVLFYVGHRVKRAVEEKAAAYGVEIPSGSTERSGIVRTYAACSLASNEEVGEALGIRIAKSEQRGHGVTSQCDYYPAAALGDQAVSDQVDKLKQLSNQPDSSDKSAATQNALSNLAKATMTDPSAPVVTVEVNGDGRDGMAGFAGAMRLMSGLAKNAGIKASEDLSGIGDRAVLGVTGQMMFLKGNTSVQLSGPGILGSKNGAVALARKIAPRI